MNRTAPRPGYQLASINYRLGLPIPRGRLIFVGGRYEYNQGRMRSWRRRLRTYLGRIGHA